MSIRKVPFAKGEYYHIYNRGNDKRLIFHDYKDYSYFLSLLFIANSEQSFNLVRMSRNKESSIFDLNTKDKLVSVGAYVLMPNHFHILITQKKEKGISKFMQKVCTGYVMYYNKKYSRTGSLFEGKFKSQYLDTDKYLKYIFSYIHLNPVKLIDKSWKERGLKDNKKTIEFLSKYKWSSYQDYIDKNRLENKILSQKDFPSYFPNKKDFNREIFGWLEYNN